ERREGGLGSLSDQITKSFRTRGARSGTQGKRSALYDPWVPGLRSASPGMTRIESALLLPRQHHDIIAWRIHDLFVLAWIEHDAPEIAVVPRVRAAEIAKRGFAAAARRFGQRVKIERLVDRDEILDRPHVNFRTVFVEQIGEDL